MVKQLNNVVVEKLVEGDSTTQQTERPDFNLSGADMRAGNYDPAAIRALFTREHCREATRALIEAGVSISKNTTQAASGQSASRLVLESA